MVYGRCRIIHEWLDWDYSIHNSEAQIGRQGRSMTYPFDFEINVKSKTARFSSTSDLPYYDTSLRDCDCYDFQERKLPCKHIYRLAVELKLIEIINRSTSEFVNKKINDVKISDDVDNHPEQIKRKKSAMDKKCTPSEINFENRTAVFAGSGKKPYDTTIESCTCRDYFIRKLPCKHIYRLRHEISNAR
jgi:transcriptional antiterminator Rof (Rho-off)